jgi:hypothetical protein
MNRVSTIVPTYLDAMNRVSTIVPTYLDAMNRVSTIVPTYLINYIFQKSSKIQSIVFLQIITYEK